MSIAMVWIFSVVVGTMIGSAKGRPGSGFIWGALLGPLGVIVTLCLTNLAKEERQADDRKLMVMQLDLQRRQIEELKALREALPKASPSSQGEQAPERPVLEDFVPENLRRRR